MKKWCIVLCSLMLWGVARSQRFPLSPLEADSVYLMDFFWDKLQKQANSVESETQLSYQWEPKQLSAAQLAKQISEWETTANSILPTGHEPGHEHDLLRSLDLFGQSYQLGLHTGCARYVDLAERILANSILRQWQTSTDLKARNEACRLLKSINRMAYSVSGKDVYVNMFVSGSAHIVNEDVNIFVQTLGRNPWYNETSITFVDNMDPIQMVDHKPINEYQREIYYDSSSTDSCEVTFHIRIPTWVDGRNMISGYNASCRRKMMQIAVNGSPVIRPEIKDGYVVVKGKWTLRDMIGISISTPILRITPHDTPNVVALQRGPFVYAFLNPEEGAVLDPKAVVTQTFSKPDDAVVLSGTMSNNGVDQRFFALPYYINSEKAKVFVPAK